MAQRISGYERQPDELYETREPWVVDALAEHVALKGLNVWESCAASGLMAQQIEAHTGVAVWQSDLVARPDAPPSSRTQATDFLSARLPAPDIDAIISNPPYGGQGRLACAFIERGLVHLRTSKVRLVAYLLAVDFDSAGGRTALFRDCPEFAMTIRLLKRIKWFDSWGVFTLHGERIGRIDDATDEADAQRLAQERFPEQHFELRVSGPSTNHAWFVWQRPALNVPHGPVTRYAPTELLEAPTPSLLLADL